MEVRSFSEMVTSFIASPDFIHSATASDRAGSLHREEAGGSARDTLSTHRTIKLMSCTAVQGPTPSKMGVSCSQHALTGVKTDVEIPNQKTTRKCLQKRRGKKKKKEETALRLRVQDTHGRIVFCELDEERFLEVPHRLTLLLSQRPLQPLWVWAGEQPDRPWQPPESVTLQQR
jgi:hypothetical protein